MNEYLAEGFYSELEKIAFTPKVTKLIQRLGTKYGPQGEKEAMGIVQQALRKKHAGKGFSKLYEPVQTVTKSPTAIKRVVPKGKTVRQVFGERLYRKEPIVGIPGKITI